MQTVNFQCGNCNNLMAVGAEHLGQQVRCPHCQAVVVAPAASAPAPAPAADATQTLTFAPPADQEDIFAPPEPSDDLFGRPEAPRVELPPPPAPAPPPTLTLDGPPAPPDAVGAVGPTLTYAPPPAPGPAGDAMLPSWMDAAPAPAPPEAPAAPFGAAAAPTEAAAPEPHETLPPVIRKPRDGGGWFIGLVFIPLISYSVLATIAIAILWSRLQQAPPPPPSPLEDLPSFDPNDDQHSTHLKLDPRTFNRARGIDVAKATSPLPDYLITQVGRKLRVGDLEIEPLAVGREVVSVDVGPDVGQPSSKPQPCRYPSLVLRLRLRNVSDNVAFQPLDSYFDRKWESKRGDPPPLTILELPAEGRTDRLFGGPARYRPPPRSSASGAELPEWVHGNDYRRVLNPGEEMEGFVCTDGDDRAAAEAVDAHRGKLLWRVHLRRGVVVRDEHHYVPVSSVVGVEFSDEDYRKSS